MKRRQFIRTAGAASAALSFMPAACVSPSERKTGLILYTLRAEMEDDPFLTLERVAKLGYNWVEAASYGNGKFYGMKPAKFRSAVVDRGLELISAHIGVRPDSLDEVVDASAEAGLKYIVLPSLPREWNKTLDGFREAAAFMNIAGEKCKSAGLNFAFHNHKNEFYPIEGEIPYDILLNNTSPDTVSFQLDLAWITGGGQNPLDYFKKYPGRFKLWHVKDLSTKGDDATLGEGTLDFTPIFDLEELSGMKYFFIEQDFCRTHSAYESIEISRNYLLDKVF